MGRHYRRSVSFQPAVVADENSTDPYAAYLGWVERGRPALAGGGASSARPEAGTVLLSQHVQVQELAPAVALGAPAPEPANLRGGAAVKPSAWQRVVGAFRR